MTGRSLLELAVGAVFAVFVVSMLLGGLLGQPVLLGYVETGSMAPTMQPGDGFVAIPSALTGPPEPGDVIVFEAQTVDGGGLTTHRVVGETDRGYVTRGDANVVTDQDSGEPPVQRAQIVAEALQVGDWVVVIPKLGLVAEAVGSVATSVGSAAAGVVGVGGPGGTQGIAYLIFAIGVAAYVGSVVSERRQEQGRARGTPRRDDGAIDARFAVLAGTVAVLALLTGSMAATGGPHEFEVISAETDSARPLVIPAGSSENATYHVPSFGVLPAVVVLEPGGDGVRVDREAFYVPSNGMVNATVTITAPPEIGLQPRYLVEHRYLGLLPVSTVRALHAVHPWLPILAIDLLVGAGLVGLGFAIVGDRMIRLDSRHPERPLGERLRRLLR